MKGEYEGKYSIVWDDCDVEMDLYASLDWETFSVLNSILDDWEIKE